MRRNRILRLPFGVALAVCLALASAAEEKTRVFVTGRSSSAESINHLNKRCPELTVTVDRDKAEYVIVRDNTGAGMGRNPHKITVFDHEGDSIYSGSTKTVGGAMKDACNAIRKDLKGKK